MFTVRTQLLKDVVSLSFALFILFQVVSAHAQTVKICDDEAGWPPFVFNPVIDGNIDTDKIEGATVELLDEIFQEINLDYSLELRPWKRCLKEVKDFGETGLFEVFTNGSYSERRARTYYISASIYSLSRGVFYSSSKYPDGIDISNPEMIKNYNVCGVHGYTYDLWGLKDGEIDTGAKSPEAALKMVSKNRCDVFPTNLMPIYGAKIMGKSIIPKNLSVYKVDYIPNRTFHIFVSQSSPRAGELLRKINAAIFKLKNNGKYKEIFSRYYKRIGYPYN